MTKCDRSNRCAKTRKYSKEQVSHIYFLRDQGLGYDLISQKTGIPVQSIAGIIRGRSKYEKDLLGIEPTTQYIKKPYQVHSDELAKEAQELRKKGISMQKIGKQLGIPSGSIQKVLARKLNEEIN